MSTQFFELSYSPLWILLCLLVGAGYAYFLYQKEGPWGKTINRILTGLRFLAVSFACFLLLEPYIQATSNEREPQQLLFIWDNSQSIKQAIGEEALRQKWNAVTTGIQDLEEEIKAEVQLVDLDMNVLAYDDSVPSGKPITAIHNSFKQVEKDFQNKSLSKVVLVSDGIYNNGISPDYYPYSFPVYTVGIGDSTEKRDIAINTLRYNKVSYQGNQFPLVAEVIQNGVKGETYSISLLRDGQVLKSEKVLFTSDRSAEEIRFLVDAKETGKQRYEVVVSGPENEFNTANNRQSAFVEIVEGKKKILLLSAFPHPDIKAFRKAIEGNENYALEICIAGLNQFKPDDYDVAILYQLPDGKKTFQAEIEELVKKETPILFTVGGNSEARSLNRINQSMQIARWSQMDEIFPALNSSFSFFTPEESTDMLLGDLPPATVPYSQFNMPNAAEVLFYQRVGSVSTQKPLLVILKNSATRQATLLAEGVWRWRLAEYVTTQEFVVFGDWLLKTIRFLTAKEDKRKFKVYPVKEVFSENEQIVFESELYNDVYEEIYDVPISLELSGADGFNRSYQFRTSVGNTSFTMEDYAPGVYQYTASATIDGQLHTESGEFSVSDFNLEMQQLKANFDLLKRTAEGNRGAYYNVEDFEKLLADLAEDEYPDTLKSTTSTKSLYDNIWALLIIVALISSEWFLRRYHGSY
jgi:hypothetical protein